MDAKQPPAAADDDHVADDVDGCDAALRSMWASVAPAWGLNADFVDRRGAAVAQAMLDAVSLRRGERVLELACGPGGVGLAAAGLVGPEGAVELTDFAPEMTAIAADRAAKAGLANVTVRDMDLQRLDYPDATFDVALCREGLMLVPDPSSALRETNRVLKPGGRAAFTVWGPRDRNPWLGLLFDAVTAELGAPVPPPGVPGPFSLETQGTLGELLAGAGFSDVDVREISAPMRTLSIDEWWSVVPSLAGPVAQLLGSLPTEMTAAIRERAGKAVSAFATADGYELPGVSFLGFGRH
ncbi:class I SAM-dependent methyltransferase [Mycobacterium sp. GA-1285]|uniref:class I SAM-dependent methyltransferase n=1 Tax=Mycobacterium sp. GA-1285 TaxID=1772282 RepID=UPI0009E68B98|nr:methyltransferase domain-containing protein [Mycobacterium sp. GA-1285]